ncbi:hypothetical protein RB195_018460 [Necator americanus]|uniref:Uncharacterized protein n=1 Tax=Necator americanus TaxID=51031 RepID=A0ABR1C9X1_NECAM
MLFYSFQIRLSSIEYFPAERTLTQQQFVQEMPSAVFCSLLAGIAAVIEIHYSIDFNHLEWSEKWSWAAADSIALCTVHAVLAFALQ